MDERDEPGWSRSEWARWWLDHGEPDEAARALEPGDEIVLSMTDAHDLIAALHRRAFGGVYEDGILFVSARDELPADRSDRGVRRPPVRAATPAGLAHDERSGAKKIA